MRCPSAALLIALASMGAAHASVRGGSNSSSSGSGAGDVVLPECRWTSAAAAISIGASGAASCYDTTAFAFANVSARPDQAYAQEICDSPSCRLVYEAAATRAPASDCLLDSGVRLWGDVLDALTPFCNQSIAMAANGSSSGYSNGSSSGSSNGTDYYLGGSHDPTVYLPTQAPDATHATTIATIVSIAVGSLLAFIVVVVAVVWYKRQSLRDLRRHAYADPLVEQKPRLGGGIFNANFASRMRFQRSGRSTQNSRTTHTATTNSSGEGGVVNVVPLRPIQPTFLGDTLWSDQELLARHMRAEDIEDIRVIGNGGHGVVYLVRHRGSRLLASKRLVQDHITREKTRLLIAEIKLVAKLEHPCIVQFVGAAWTTESDLQALFEYMPNGDLCTHLAKTSQPDEREQWDLVKLKIAMDIAEALVYVHSFSPPLVHRDLKSRNVLLDENMRAKLTDFGVSRFYSTNNTMTTGIGTSRWLAPEVMAGGGTYDQSCDIYSLGIVISELDTHRLPFAGLRMPSGNPMPEMSILQLVSQGRLQPAFRDSCPESLRAIALRCVAFDPKDRPSAIEVSYALRTIAKNEFGM